MTAKKGKTKSKKNTEAEKQKKLRDEMNKIFHKAVQGLFGKWCAEYDEE